ncbi:MAG: hypothetical protein AAFV87_13010 [Pseudomonadota bacterium]
MQHEDMKNQQQAEFQERIARINANQGQEQPILVGDQTEVPLQPKQEEEERRIPIGGIVAFVLAAVILMVGNVAAFQTRALPTANGEFLGTVVLAIGPWGITGLLLFVVMIGFGMRDKHHCIGIAAGLVAVFLGEPYLAWLFPQQWAQLYSLEHVDAMLIQAGLRTPPLAY